MVSEYYKSWFCRNLVFLGIVFIAAQSLFAQELTIEEVVVTGSRNENPYEDVPAFVSVLRTDSTDKESLLESSPGVNLNSYGAFGDTLSLSIRGSSSDQVLLLIDGMRIGSGMSSGISFLSMEGVERIEVFRGGASTLYGADAVGGVVNIITKKTEGNYFDSTLSYGSFNTLGVSASLGVESDGSGIAFGVEHRESEGNFQYNFRGEELKRENNGFKQDALQFKTEQKISDIILSILTRFELQTKEVPGSYFTPTPEALQRDSRNTTLLGVRYNKNSTLLSFNSSVIYHNLFYYDELFVKRKEPSLSDDFSTQHFLKMDKRLKHHLISISPEIRTEFIRSSSAGRHARSVYSIFLQDEADFFEKKLMLLPSLRLEHFSDREVNSIENAFRLGTRLKIIKELYVKANIGTSYRVPTFLDLYWPEDPYARGNPDLVPERGMDMDAGMGWGTKFLRGEVAYFKNHLKNLIQWAPDERGKWTPSNIGRAELSGVELMIDGNLKDYLSLHLAYTNLRALDLTETNYYRKRLIYRPENAMTVKAATEIFDFKISFEAVCNSWKYTDRENEKENRLPGYCKMNAGISSPSFNGFLFEFLANNLGDKRYEEVPGYPQPGRNFLFNLNYKI
jgi:vitamin B12 transporter